MEENRQKTSNEKPKRNVPFSMAYCNFFLGLCRFVRPFLHGKCLKTEAFKEQKKRGAMLIVSNHLSAYDFIHFSSAMYGAPLNFVVAENMMYSMPIFAKLIGSYHAITKKQYFADFQCIKNIKRYLDAGISVLICPEGKVSADGTTGPISPSIAKLIQWLGYPVGVIKMKGASLARPKWAHNLRMIRKGSVYTECDVLFTAEEAKTLSKDELLDGVKNALEHNEHKWQIENGIKFEGKHYAEGLERLLYRCPKCGEEFCIQSRGSRLVCKKCANEVEYGFDGRLKPIGESIAFERIDIWFSKQRKNVAELVKREDFVLEESVNLLVENVKNNGYRFIANGTLRLDRHKLSFDTNWQNRPIGVKAKYGVNSMTCDFSDDKGAEPVEEEFRHVEFAVDRCETVANIPGTAIDMYDQNHVYRFMFDKVQAATKYVLAIEEAYKLAKK